MSAPVTVAEIGNFAFGDDPQGAADDGFRSLRQQPIAVRQRDGIERTGGRIRRQRRRHRAFGDVDLAFGEVREGVRRHPDILCSTSAGV